MKNSNRILQQLICSQVAQGELRSADIAGAVASLPDLAEKLKQYPNAMRYNMDETGLYWRLLPMKTITDASDSVEGFKRSKERVTVVIITNAEGFFEVLKFGVFGVY